MAKLYTIRNRAITERGLEERYNNFLDEVYESVNICGYKYAPSDALKSVDEVAYNEGYNNWLDMMISDRALVEKDGEYYDGEDWEIEDSVGEI